jgi:hypothetical protein
MGNRRDAYRVLVGKHEGKRQLGKPRARWEDNIKIDLTEISWEGVDWIDLAVNRDKCWGAVNKVIKFRVAQS